MRVIRLFSEETIEEGIYSIAQEKLKLGQDLVNAEEDSENTSCKKFVKKDVSKLLRIALDVDISEDQIGDINFDTDEGAKSLSRF